MITIQGAIQINPVQSRAYTTERADTGFSTASMTVTGYTARDRTSLAAAKETARQLNEMASNYWYRIVHVADSEDNQIDGLYELRGASVTATPATSNSKAALFAVSVTLRRAGGERTGGTNLSRRVRPLAILRANSYSITTTSWFALPVGADGLDLITGNATRASADGSVPLRSGTTAERFVLGGADVSKGECKVWDTGGVADDGSAAPSGWTRVWAADHRFADPRYVAIDNGLLRVSSNPSTGTGSVALRGWLGAAWSAARALNIEASSGTTTFVTALHITELNNYRVVIRQQTLRSTVPFFLTTTLTLERGKTWVLVEQTASSSATLRQSVPSSLNLVARAPTAQRDAAHTGDGTLALTSTEDNWFASVTPAADADGLQVYAAAVETTNTNFYMEATSTMLLQRTSTTSLTAAWGILPHNTVTYPCWEEAEAGTLAGTAALAADAGASGGGNNCVSLPSLTASVRGVATVPQPAPTIIRAWARVKNTGVSASDTVWISIRNVTGAADLVVSTSTFAVLGGSGAWKWISVEANPSTWNGTDVLRVFVARTAAGGGGALLVDAMMLLSIADGQLTYVRDVARQAMTDTHTWEEATTAVW